MAHRVGLAPAGRAGAVLIFINFLHLRQAVTPQRRRDLPGHRRLKITLLRDQRGLPGQATPAPAA